MSKTLKTISTVSVLFLLCVAHPGLSQYRGGASGKRPSGGAARPAGRPSSTGGYRPSSSGRPSSTGGYRPSSSGRPSSTGGYRPSSSGRPSSNGGYRPSSSNRPQGGRYPNYAGNRPNRPGSGNNVNIYVNNSKNIKVNNYRNTVVRRNMYRPYTRPAYRWGGYRYRCYNPYRYHPYRPYRWGPRWRPWGFFVAALAATAIIVSFADADVPKQDPTLDYWALMGVPTMEQQYLRSGPSLYSFMPPEELQPFQTGEEGKYYYDDGVFYLKDDDGYTVVAAPLGGIIKTLPEGYETIELDDANSVTNYYYGGAFYEKIAKGYKVVAPTAGAIVEKLPEGGEETKIGEVTYVKLGETYYQPIEKNGKNVYEVADVEEDK